jgi:hypothetical protein
MKRNVTDKNGATYQLEALYSVDGIRINLRTECQAVGYANVIIQDSHQWMIADLFIYDESIIPAPKIFQFLLAWFDHEPKRRSFRGLGLGTVLLQVIIGEAREYGVRKLTGVLHHKDRMKSSFLVHWCAKNGFHEVSRKPGHPRNAEVLMEMDL